MKHRYHFGDMQEADIAALIGVIPDRKERRKIERTLRKRLYKLEVGKKNG